MRVVATNRATEHPNLVHNDDYARSVGFQGGLVPGVDVYAYLTRPAIDRFGREWLERGEGEVRFVKPVYDGDELDIDVTDEGDGELTVEARCGGQLRALLIARDRAAEEFDTRDVIPEASVFKPKLKASRRSFHEGMVLGSLSVTLTEGDCTTQLAEVHEVLDLYALERIVHPGHLLRFADEILAANVDLPPWMHVGSAVHHHGLVRWNEALSVRARVMATFDRRGNEFIQLDVLLSGANGRPRMRVSPYTAIYKPSFGGA